MHQHSNHPDVIKRLKRVEGHIRSVIKMLEGGRSCLEIAQQMQAVEKAVAQAKEIVVREHIDHCLERAIGPKGGKVQETLREFKEITKYL